MCHKPDKKINTAKMSCDTFYSTTYNGADLFKKFNVIYKCEHKFYEIFNHLNSKYCNCTGGISVELRYCMINNKKKEKTFIIIGRKITMIYDSRVGFLDLKAISLKNKLDSDELDKFIAYMKPLMINATDRNTINTDNYQFYFNKLLTSKGIIFQNEVLTKEIINAFGLKAVSAICGVVGTCFMI